MSTKFSHCSSSNAIHFHYSNATRIPKPFLSFSPPPKPHFTTPPPPPATTTTSTSSTANGNNNNPKSSSFKRTNQDSSKSSKPLSNSAPTIKAPTAPWMRGPLIVEPNQLIDFSKRKPRKDFISRKNDRPDNVLSDKVSGGRGKKAMKMIFEGIEKLQETENSDDVKENPEIVKFRFSPGELWGEESCELEAENRIVETRNSLEKIGLDVSLGETGKEGNLKSAKKMPWMRDKEMVVSMTAARKEKVKTAAELHHDSELLERLRGEAAKMRSWVKVKKAGVTQAVLDQVHLIWKSNELAMIKFDIPLSHNMDRAREIVEMKTGGFVVWSKKDSLVVFRGCNYEFSNDQESCSLNISCRDTVSINGVNSNGSSRYVMSRKAGEEESISIRGSLYEREADRLLDSLGPRYVDWWWRKPLPVDADLLPEVVPGLKTPFRLCPPGVRSKLTDVELTQLRMLARSLPTHFVLGRNRKLQGLAAAILKLWEKCHIAKIALKRGFPNTDNEQMAYELQFLTEGVLLLRNKFFIILYRGNDFLPPQVANMVVDREMELRRRQLEEEAARLKAIEDFPLTNEQPVNRVLIGTLSEFQSMRSKSATLKDGINEAELELKAKKERIEKELRSTQRKQFILKKKIEKSAKELANLEWLPSEQVADQELVTNEERECLRKIGMKMDSSLLLGRRGIFDGLIEGMHQHWKHREVVKVITMQRRFSQVIDTANLLEAESGGILISIDKLKEGHAIIVYRGKNYSRPKLVLNNLLSKRDALDRSLEMQRIGSLKYFAHQTELEIYNLKCKLAELQEEIEQIDQTALN